MTASTPQIPKVVIFTLAGTSFAEDLIDAKLVAVAGDEQKVVTLDGVVHKDIAPTSYQLELNCVQDWSSVRPGLAYYLYANQGTSVAFVFKNETGAESTTLPKFTGTCVLVPINYGGEGGAYAESAVTLPITGTLTLDSTP